MDDQSPLYMQFKQFDTDGDSKLSADQIHQLLKMLGKNVYKGSVNSAVILINQTADEPATNNLLTFPQFKEYYESLDNPLKHDIWKSRYNLLRTIKQVRQQKQKKQENAPAAPGAKPGSPAQSSFRGDIEITVGPTNQNYNSYLKLKLQKMPKAESKPFIKLVFQQSTPQSAKQLEIKIKKFQTSLFDLMKSSDPQSAQILDYIHIITNVSQNKLNLFITVSNEPLIQLGILAAQFLDRVLGAKFQANLELSYQFNVDLNKFIDKVSDYSFYNTLTQNYHFKLVWNACNFKQNAKQVLKAMQAFSQLKYDKLQPLSLMLIGLIHSQVCQIRLLFDNADFQTSELDSKNQILQGLGQIQQKMSQQTESLGLYQVLNSFQNKFSIQASIGDWKVQGNIHIQDLKELFSKNLLPVAHQQQVPVNAPQQQFIVLNDVQSSNVPPGQQSSGSDYSLKKSKKSSVKSIKSKEIKSSKQKIKHKSPQSQSSKSSRKKPKVQIKKSSSKGSKKRSSSSDSIKVTKKTSADKKNNDQI